jgi:hypothetical protein
LLAVAGIKSYPALINAGYSQSPVSPDFPESIFNHVILCVPGATDSTWLECTSKNNEAGFLGSFTENKNALLLTENGGIIVSTPKSSYQKNILRTVNHVYLDGDGGAEVKGQLHATGSFYQLIDQVSKMEKRSQRELFVKYLDYKEPDEFSLMQNEEYAKKEDINLVSNYARLYDFKAGDKFFFPLSVNKLCDEKITVYNNRKSDYLFEFPYTKIDTTIFHLPVSFKADDIPKDKELSEGPVYYNRKVVFNKASNTIEIISLLLLRNNLIPANQYKNVSEIMNNIEKEEATKLVLQK